MYLRNLEGDLRAKFREPFTKKVKGTKRKAEDDRVGEGMEFPFPDDIPGFVAERDATWDENFRELPAGMLNDALAAASIIAERKSIKETEKGGQIFSVCMKEEGVYAVEKSTGKILAPERVQDAIDRDDLELWLTAWNDEIDGLSMEGEHISHNHTMAEIRKMGINDPALPTRMISAAKYRGAEFDRRKGRMICQGFRAIEGVHHDGKIFAASPSQYDTHRSL